MGEQPIEREGYLIAFHFESHQEGWRDWPDETPPTTWQRTVRGEERWQLQQATT